ncbi:uncharacterized protein ATNIH1004_010240 [Aspergillus tanneri]|uniref:Uncharacterized protein n=1 Tax=Aspergillus tanneri TaxID=1220188 RepID=A0A5M9M9K3_9EURO|nr:uncharacterized protein ATNIH1004_010240 [Aspergillus tanneri]KAA8643471.1 hypothetical protein ATNIH1004_010240 [Aspergillus tanneri]
MRQNTPPTKNNRDSSPETPSEPLPSAPESSPLAEPSSSFLENIASPQTPDGPASQLKRSLQRTVEAESEERKYELSAPIADDLFIDLPPGASFNQAQRILKNGKEVEAEDDVSGVGRILRSQPSRDAVKVEIFPKYQKSTRAYKNTLDCLVTQAVDDNEIEASIADLKAAFENEDAGGDGMTSVGSHQINHLDEGVLTSAFGDQEDEMGLRRLLDAVRRTEAFDLEKYWAFFDYGSGLASPLEFPRDSIAPGTYMDVLREPESRQRAFHSGILDFALSRGFLPDDLLLWIFNSIPLEPQEGLRYAYCRAFKVGVIDLRASASPSALTPFQHSDAERVKLLIRPDTVDLIFQRLGATIEALAVAEPVVPGTVPKNNSSKDHPQHQAALLSVFDLLRGAANLFADDTREHILLLLFRLTLDISLTRNPMICSELERTITATLESIPEDTDDDMEPRICTSIYNTVKDPILQSRLLRHILPTSSWIASLRSRLALSFVLSDPAPLTETPDTMLYLRRIIDLLKDRRFDIKRYKGKNQAEYDYGELGAITFLLNTIVDSGWSGMNFSTKEVKRQFNSEIDTLADRIKKIFTSIEDSGASHLKRTLAKEALEALHYRIVYSVRTKPPPKKSIFGDTKRQNQPQLSHFFKTDKEIPIRSHDNPS